MTRELLLLFFSVAIEAAGDILDYLCLVLDGEVQFHKHLCFSPHLFSSWFVVKLMLLGSRLEPPHPMDMLKALLSVHLDDEVIQLLYLLGLVLNTNNNIFPI